MGGPLCFASARELAAMIAARQVSAREVMSAFLGQIRRFNPSLNAIVARLDDDSCLALAAAADRMLASGKPVGPLHGLPIAFKDLEAAVGFPFTKGSPIFKDVMPAQDTVIVERLRLAGTIPIGKTNVPEFGMGSHTYNKVYGTTYNPYDRTKSAGGSSGRRPTVGLVPIAPTPLPMVGVSVKGPMARSVADAAFMLSVMAGVDGRDPQSYPSNPQEFTAPLDRGWKGVRVAWSPALGGLPLDRRVRTVLEQQRQVFVDLGCIVEEATPDFSDVDKIFLTLRSWANWNTNGALLAEHRSQIKPEAIWDIEAGAKLTGEDVAWAIMKHGALLERMRVFQEKYEFLVCAVNQVPPFAASLDWPKSIDGVEMENYVAWMKSAYWISTTCRPAISVPAGFTPEGLPVGIQIVGRHRDDLGVLKLGYAFEQATGVGKRRPEGV